MKSYVGISKNIGNGMRIGFALPVELSCKPSKRDQANSNFTTKAKSMLTDSLYSFYLSHGVLVSKADINKVNMENCQPIVEKLDAAEPIMTSISKSLRLYGDTGSLSQQSKEKIMNDVYSFEEFVLTGSGDLHAPISSAMDAYKNKLVKIALFPYALGVLGTIVSASVFGVGGFMLGGLFFCASAIAYVKHSSRTKTEAERAATLNLCKHVITPIENMVKI